MIVLPPTISPYGRADCMVSGARRAFYDLTFDGGDRADVSGVPTKVATLTSGTVAMWLKAVAGAQVTMVALTSGAAPRTDLAIQLVNRAVFLNCSIDGVIQWRWTSSGTLTAGTWYHLAIAHNGTVVSVYLNGAPMAGAFINVVDKAKWWKAIVTDATNKATIGLIGAHKLGGGYTEFYASSLTQIVVDSRVWTATDAKAAMLDATVDKANLAYYRVSALVGAMVLDETGSADGVLPGGAANPVIGGPYFTLDSGGPR